MSEKDMTQTIEATVAAMEGVYDTQTPEMDPHGDPIFKVAFETAEGVKIFWINSYNYYALKVGMKGKLEYRGDTMIAFEPWIKASFPIR